MCGIVGVVGTSAVNQRIYDGLTVLQHRGQDAAGIATSGDGELCVRKGSGLVRDVFQQEHMVELKGNMGIGHVRYPTAGCDGIAEAAASSVIRATRLSRPSVPDSSRVNRLW